MKTVIVTINKLAPGDFVALCCTNPEKGGVSNINYWAPPPRDEIQKDVKGNKIVVEIVPQPKDLLAHWANELMSGKHFVQNEIQGRPRGDNQFVLTCSDLVSDLRFFTTIEGPGGTDITVEEI